LDEALKPGLQRHVWAALNPVKLGDFRPFAIGQHDIGYVRPENAENLIAAGCQKTDGGLVWEKPATTDHLARALATAGQTRYRDEAFDVFAGQDGLPLGPSIARIDRGAIAYLGIAARGVHLNGFVRDGQNLKLWVARRSLSKKPDPGKFDHIVAGGIGAGYTARDTLIKEAAEEAGMPESIAAKAVYGGAIAYRILRPEGLRRDLLFCYDLELPADFTPHPSDGEVEDFSLWPIEQVLATMAAGDGFKFNVNLVILDFCLRHGVIVATGLPELAQLQRNIGNLHLT
jgi:8-oxo-dGTP pyrophosphatase MutT (NUDIX family)